MSRGEDTVYNTWYTLTHQGNVQMVVDSEAGNERRKLDMVHLPSEETCTLRVDLVSTTCSLNQM